jgi:hypothetical protein
MEKNEIVKKRNILLYQMHEDYFPMTKRVSRRERRKAERDKAKTNKNKPFS